MLENYINKIDFNFIKLLIAIGVNSNIKSVAAMLDCSETTIIRQLKALEKAIGIHVYIRDSNKLLLTSKGKKLYYECKKMYRCLLDYMHEMQADKIVLRYTSFLMDLDSTLLDKIRDFAQENENNILVSGNYDLVYDKMKINECLENMSVDLVISNTLPIKSKNIKSLKIRTDEMCFAYSLTYCNNKIYNNIEDLKEERIFVTSSEDDKVILLNKLFKEKNKSLNIKIEDSSYSSLLFYAEKGGGLAFVPKSYVINKELQILPLGINDNLYISYNKKNANPYIKFFLDYILSNN